MDKIREHQARFPGIVAEGSESRQVKVGSHEFTGEGDEAAVRADYAAWREMIVTVGQQQSSKVAVAAPAATASSDKKDSLLAAEQRERLDRLFLIEEERVSLRIKPQGEDAEADALVLILYGYKCLRSVEPVLATQVKAALEQSGFRVDRLDRVAAKYLGQGADSHWWQPQIDDLPAFKFWDRKGRETDNRIHELNESFGWAKRGGNPARP